MTEKWNLSNTEKDIDIVNQFKLEFNSVMHMMTKKDICENTYASITPLIGLPTLDTGMSKGLLLAKPWSAIICKPCGKGGRVRCLQNVILMLQLIS